VWCSGTMASATASGSDNEAVAKKQSKAEKSKDGSKVKSSSTPAPKSSILQSLTSFGPPSSSHTRLSKQSMFRTSPRSQGSPLPESPESTGQVAAADNAVGNMLPPPTPVAATKSSSSSPGSTPTMSNPALPLSSAMQSKSDPLLTDTHPLVSITPPQHNSSPAPGLVSLGSSQSTDMHSETRPRGHSTSTIRRNPSPTSTLSSSHIGGAPMSRVISNPLPQPSLRGSSPGSGTGRGRTVSFTPGERSPSRDATAAQGARSRSPLRDIASSFRTFSQSSSQTSPAGSRPSTARSAGEEEKKYFWHRRAGTPRPWFDPSEETKAEPESPFAHNIKGPAAAPRESLGLWHRRGSVPPEQSESWTRTKEVSSTLDAPYVPAR
jgi:hypothetical protein